MQYLHALSYLAQNKHRINKNSKCQIIVDNLIKNGWWELHDAALLFGAEVEEWPYEDYGSFQIKGHPLVYAAEYSKLLAPVVEYCQINVSHFGCRANLVRQYAWKVLQRDGLRNLEETWKFLSRAESIHSVLQEFKDSYFIVYSEAPVFSAIQLHTIARYGMWLLFRPLKNDTDKLLSIVWGLALIGVAKKIYSHQSNCQFCFRKAWPGNQYCEDHSQSQSDNDNRSLNYMQYRVGKKVHALAIERGLIENIHRKGAVSHAANITKMVDVLFPMILVDEDKSCEREWIICSLLQSNRVIEYLDEKEILDFSYEQLIQILRNKLDRYEWSDLDWKYKIISAELWFSLEAEASPGVRGYGTKTLDRIEQAQKLMAKGMNKSQIAKELNITPSAVSKWLKRKPELKKIFEKNNLPIVCH